MKNFSVTLLALIMPFLALAQGWPSKYDGVMLQGFYWDSYVDSQWSNLQSQADDLSRSFSLIWVPQSGNCNSSYNQMGYTPVYYFNQNSSFGTEQQLRSFIKALKAKGTGIIEDVVLNHHNNLGVNGNWVDFPAETYNGVTYQFLPTDVCANDDGGKTKTWASANGIAISSNYDTGEDWDGCRDIDMKSDNVKKINNAYINFLLNDLGYAGCRYDMVKGFSASFIGEYNSNNNVNFSVGEYWDGNASTVISWIDGTKVNGTVQSAAFDFPFRYTVRDAINNNDWTKLAGTSIISNAAYRRYSVTFVENHDTEYRSSAEQQDPIRKDTLAANAFLLAMPGTPCVAFKHWQAYPVDIKNMIECRKIAGITNESTFSKFRGATAYYANQVTGENGKLMVVVGSNTAGVAPSTATWVKVLSGYHYDYYLAKTLETPWASMPSGEYEAEFGVKLTAVSATATASLVYTLDGTEPTASSKQVADGATVQITGDCTLKVGLLVNGEVKKVISRDYTIRTFEPHTATVHLKDPGWESVYFYLWDKDNKQLNGSWPGSVVTDYKMINGNKYYYITKDIPTKDYYYNFIFNMGSSANQSVDIGPIKEDVYYELAGTVNGKYTVNSINPNEGGDLVGDINGDGVVNVSDVSALVNIILAGDTSNSVADVNSDGEINVSDVSALVNIILSNN